MNTFFVGLAVALAQQGGSAGSFAAADDYSVQSLRAAAAELRSRYPAAERELPLDAKADFFERVLWRYHTTADDQVYCKVRLPAGAGEAVRHVPGADSSTWNGALLAALSYKYAATHEPATLQRIVRLLKGLHRFQTVTSKPGYLVRSMCRDPADAHPHMKKTITAEGETWFYWDEPAKGTYNQVVGGYAVMMMLAYHDLPKEVQAIARDDLTASGTARGRPRLPIDASQRRADEVRRPDAVGGVGGAYLLMRRWPT